MLAKKVEPNKKLATQFITACGREGRPDDAARHLHAMEKAGLKPDLQVRGSPRARLTLQMFNAMIAAFGKNGMTDRAKSWLDKLKVYFGSLAVAAHVRRLQVSPLIASHSMQLWICTHARSRYLTERHVLYLTIASSPAKQFVSSRSSKLRGSSQIASPSTASSCRTLRSATSTARNASSR